MGRQLWEGLWLQEGGLVMWVLALLQLGPLCCSVLYCAGLNCMHDGASFALISEWSDDLGIGCYRT